MKVETEVVQLKLGETVVAERKVIRGTIKQNTVIVALSEKRQYCYAMLIQETEAERINGSNVWGLSAWQPTTKGVWVKKNINGQYWKKWPIPEGSAIGVFLENVKARRIRATIITDNVHGFS